MKMLNATRGCCLIALLGAMGWSANVRAQDTFPVPPDPTEKPTVPPDTTVRVVVPMERVYAAWSARPLGAKELSVAVPENTIQLYQDAAFRDDVRTIDNVTSHAAGQAHDMPGMMEDSLTSLRWNLPPGVVVTFYEDDGARGERLTIWGSGESETVTGWNFNDKASSWSWYYAGGFVRASEVMERGLVVYPFGTVHTTTLLPAGSVTLYSNKNFDGQSATITPFTSDAHATLNKVPAGMNDKITSMRWNLPPGVVMMFYQDGDGRKQQAAIWGSGEINDVDAWDFNDKISRWSWHYIGSPEAEVLGYEPPLREGRAREFPPRERTPMFNDAIDLVARDISANKLEIHAADLVARKNPTGEGTFVYVPRTRFEGVERHIVWIVVDDKAYAVTGPAKMITPDLPSPMQASESMWSRTGLSSVHAEEDAVKILFRD